MNNKSKSILAIAVILVTIILDQLIKIIIKTNFHYGESVRITDWFYLTFIENNGMAFGMQVMPKAVQTIMRLIFSGFILWYIMKLVKTYTRVDFLT